MKHILAMRRVFETVKERIWKYSWVKNPHYSAQQALEYERQGLYYSEEEFIYKDVPKVVKRRRSHIEYRIKCAYCQGTKGWVRRKDAKYCSSSCRNLAKKKRDRSKKADDES
ncbi:MAG: hypothetical protein AAGD05_18550 [Bacteroidota bacterium]